MLYKNSKKDKLDMELFKKPTAEYRGAPFWAWNCKLRPDVLKRQIEYMKAMGFGGFHMHSRSGMATEYLSDEFMDLIKICVDKAKEENMLAYLYDEDRFPSGAAGGIVTKDRRYRQRYICFKSSKIENSVSLEEAYITGNPALLVAFDIELNEDGTLKSYKKAEKDSQNVWYVYFMTVTETGWYNDQTYLDTMNKEAVGKFIEVTHERYKSVVGDEFDKTVPSIFTDEPRFFRKDFLGYANEKKDINLPWVYDFADTFQKEYEIDIIDRLPELVWNLENDEISTVRYYYHNHVCDRFVQGFCDMCGKWCSDNNMYLTGHVFWEPTLYSQTANVGEAMRNYRNFGIPGIDILGDDIELSSAKQAQSVVHQYGKEGVMSELYGVTNWDFDFRGHKFQGDWQAACGITLRVPHLAWVSMKGAAKRDYPASISYQSPWFIKYPCIEDHYARLNTALTRGTPLVDVAVIHPIESYWLEWGPEENSHSKRQALEENFTNIIEWLLFGQIDFDFISEALLPELCIEKADGVYVGEMKYKAIIVPNLKTIRKSTLDFLESFKKKGGRVIFMEDCPEYVEAKKSDEAKALYDNSIQIPYNRLKLMESLEPERRIEILNSNGARVDDFLYTLRHDTDGDWLFIALGKKESLPPKDMCSTRDIEIVLNDEFTPVLFDTLNGEICEIPFLIKNGQTRISLTLNNNDSLLVKLMPKTKSQNVVSSVEQNVLKRIEQLGNVKYHTQEENVYLLDMARYSLDGSELYDTEEILRIDMAVRKILSFNPANGRFAQPWTMKEEVAEHFVTLHFTIQSNVNVSETYLAFEEAEEIFLNGKPVENKICGYYIDEDIHKIRLGDIKEGENELIVKVPISNSLGLENMFLLGDFAVKVLGTEKVIDEKPSKIAFSSITELGFPFYGGNFIYETEIETPLCDLEVDVTRYRGAMVGVAIDAGEEKNVIFSPYKAVFKNVTAGKHTIKFILYGNRYNTVGALHRVPDGGAGAGAWYTKDWNWTYEYKLKETGILKSPVINILEL